MMSFHTFFVINITFNELERFFTTPVSPLPKSSSFYCTELSPDQENIARPPKAHFKNMKRLCLTGTPNGFLSGLEIKRNLLSCFLKEKTIHFWDERLKSLVIDGVTWRNMGVQMRKGWRDGIDVNLKGNPFKEHGSSLRWFLWKIKPKWQMRWEEFRPNCILLIVLRVQLN